MLKIDVDSLIECLQEIVSGRVDGGWVNPVFRYDRETGRCRIQSSLTPPDDTQIQIGGQLDTNEGLDCMLEGLPTERAVKRWFRNDRRNAMEWARTELIGPAIECADRAAYEARADAAARKRLYGLDKE
jgi:hypothetical protein